WPASRGRTGPARPSAGPRHRRGVDVIEGPRLRGDVARLHGDVLGGRPVANPSAATTPDTSWPGMIDARRWPARQVHSGQSSSLCVMPTAVTLTSTSPSPGLASG